MPRTDTLEIAARSRWAETAGRPAPPIEKGRFLIPLLAGLAFFSFAYNQTAEAGGEESRFLALLAVGVLAAVAALAGRELLWGAVSAVTVLWIVDYGPHRGAVLTLLLALSLVSAAHRQHDLYGAGRRLLVPLAFGVQLLVRSDLLLPPLFDARTLVSVLLLPAVAGGALAALAGRFGGRRALVAGLAVFVLAPGWNVTTCLALMALAAGGVLGRERETYTRRWAALPMLLAPALLKGWVGVLATLAGLALALPRRLGWVAPLGAALVGLLLPAGLDWPEAWAAVALVPLLLPGLGRTPPRRLGLAATGLLIALVAIRLGAGRDAMAAGVGLLALALPAEGASERLQRVWSLGLGAGTLLLATYPWVRLDPLADALGLAGLELGWPHALAVLLAAAGLGLALERLGRVGWTVPTACLALFLALAAQLPGPAFVAIRFREVVLEPERPRWSHGIPAHEIPTREVQSVVVDSNLVQGAEVAAGTEVGEVRLLGADGQVLGRFPLRAGFETGEWAAGRPDVAGRPDFRAPEPFLSYVAPDGSFFGRRFRARSPRSPTPLAPERVVISRAADLPPHVRLVVYRLELRAR